LPGGVGWLPGVLGSHVFVLFSLEWNGRCGSRCSRRWAVCRGDFA